MCQRVKAEFSSCNHGTSLYIVYVVNEIEAGANTDVEFDEYED